MNAVRGPAPDSGRGPADSVGESEYRVLAHGMGPNSEQVSLSNVRPHVVGS